ncbi:MAG: hypothetical protein HY868_04815 [Chloroflexi bacterium]|nr:hypothetical protein [Chloroflexota bacterium]
MASQRTPTNVPSLQFFLLGAFRIQRNGEVVRLPTRKIESLLAYLLLFPDEHPREKLAALFWGDVLDEHARSSLRTALATIRKHLGDDILVADRETAQINPGFPLWVDAREIFDLASQAQSENLKSKIENYRGDLLPDFYDDWVLAERECVRAQYHAALLQLIQHARSQSRYADAIALAQKLLARDPANEAAHQHLIVCYIAMGNRAAALKQYAECERMLRAELNVAPSRDTIALYEKIRAEETGRPSHAVWLGNLPMPLTSFVGREREQKELKKLVGKTRLLTLSGAGGCGKTRLAIQVATDLAATNHFRDGVWWVDLAALSDPALVPQTVAMVFNLSESPGMALISVLTNYLRAKELLLVVDNCEHLLGACAQLIGTLSSACPKLRIMATSREILNISGEVAWRVPSLASPDAEHLPPLDQLRQYDAIQLFTERAMSVAANWRLVENAAPAAQVCSRLDGIPLAIEFAAARLQVLSAQEIAARLDDCFNLLTRGSRDALPRHRTLRAAMDWSYDLLSDAERVLLRRLSVFAGGFSLKAVEAVCAQKDESGTLRVKDESEMNALHPPFLILYPSRVLDLLTSLIDKSLVVVEHKDSETRYRLLETVRQYAREKFAQAESGEAEQAQTRHRDYFVEWIEQAYPHLGRADALEWKARIEWNYADLRAAFEHALETDPRIALRIAWGLRNFFSWRGLVPEGRAWLERLLPKTEAWGQDALHAHALNLAGFLAARHFDPASAIRFCEEGLAIAQSAEDGWKSAFAFEQLGWAYGFLPMAVPGGRNPADCCAASLKIFQDLGDETMAAWVMSFLGFFLAKKDHENDLARGVLLMQQAMDKHRALGNQIGVAATAIYLGIALTYARDVYRAEPYTLEAITICEELQHVGYHSIAAMIQAAAVFWKGELHRAMACAMRALQLYRQAGNISAIVMTLQMIALCIGPLGKPEPAARILGTLDFHWETQRAYPMTIKGTYDEEWGAIRAQLGDPVFEKARSEGRALSLDQAVEYALENAKNV